jgi:hypothetical protein
MQEHSEHDPRLPRPKQRELETYRAAVADLLLDIAGQAGADDAAKAETILLERTREPDIAGILAATPEGADAAVHWLLGEVRRFRAGPHAVADLAGLVRVVLLAQIDLIWWGHLPPYPTDRRLRAACDMVDLEELRRRGQVGFWYERPAGLLGRALREAHRVARPASAPPCPEGGCARARPELVAMLNQVAAQLARRVESPAAALWVSGVARSQQRQRHLCERGYPEFLPSAHCVGYAADVEVAWLRRFDAHGTLAALLLERQRAGEANIIDEGPTWHVCVSPAAAADLRRHFDSQVACLA